MEDLQRLSIINKLCIELLNHLGFSDKVLAEFIYSLAHADGQLVDLPTFRTNLASNGADFSSELVEILWNVMDKMETPTTTTKEVTYLNLSLSRYLYFDFNSLHFN